MRNEQCEELAAGGLRLGQRGEDLFGPLAQQSPLLGKVAVVVTVDLDPGVGLQGHQPHRQSDKGLRQRGHRRRQRLSPPRVEWRSRS